MLDRGVLRAEFGRKRESWAAGGNDSFFWVDVELEAVILRESSWEDGEADGG